ncbi:hypothetical protein [Acinetobacter towneri]|uniref:hypothetical protein n=1 Tax=Acinetobacter towneri TaxID=202956 RepID=UPI00188CD541|nr:hypothetical protein [Acinetobacter towneri]MBF4520038.1 hypothetical protein [Acinetobacter towneri]MDM1721929.1 hypothetical protein [Acinetobacter towneri]
MITFCYIGFFPDYEKYFFQNIETEGINAVSFNPMDLTGGISYFHKLPRFIRNWYHKKLIQKYIQAHPDYIYIFNEHRLLLQAIVYYIESKKPFRGHLLIRNPMAQNEKIHGLLEKLKHFSIQLWSFDHDDCQKYGFHHYSQFLTVLPKIKNVQINYDLVFIGRNKGRDIILNSLKDKADSVGLSFLIDLKDGTKSSNISYEDYLEKSLSARCIVEILQDGQSGMTLRPVEALFYNRKLLTNNQLVINEPFYHTSNILVMNDIDTLSVEELMSFINKPIVQIDDTIKERYSTAGLLKMLSKNIENQ